MADLSYVLHDLVMRMDRDAEARLAPLGLTLRRFVALTVIAEHPGVTSRQLSVPLGVSEPATSQLVAQLVGRDVVEDGSLPGSGRAKAWRVTASGHRLFEQARERLGGDFDEVVRRAGEDPDDLARRLLNVLTELDRPTEES